MVAVYVAAVRVFAAEFKLTVAVVPAPPASAPPPKTVNHAEVLMIEQVSEAFPMLVNWKLCELGVNGPLNNPEAENPVAGAATSGCTARSKN